MCPPNHHALARQFVLFDNFYHDAEVSADGHHWVTSAYATDYVEHTPQPGVPPTREGFKQTAIALKKAFPDLRYTIDDVVDGGDRIVHRLTASGTMKGEFAGMPATGKHATWTECEQRVKGRSGARFKKAASVTEQEAILRSWGFGPADV